VAVIADGSFDAAAVARAIEGNLRQAGVENATATVRTVDVLPRHPQTGKTRRFIPL
jgi:hypothetical protein